MNATSQLNVLVVDDEPRMRELLLRALPDMGYAPRSARHGQEAMRMLAEQPVDIAILDINLPGMSGIELFAKIRERWPRTAVIVLTGYGDLESAKSAIRLDVVDFLTKPCHLGDLEIALDRARRRFEQVQEPGALRKPALANEQATLVPEAASEHRTLADSERSMILDALIRNRGNRSATATELGISIRTLYYRLAEYEKQGYSVQ